MAGSGKSGLQLPAISLGLWQNFGDADDMKVFYSERSQHSIMASLILILLIITVLRVEMQRSILEKFLKKILLHTAMN